MVANSLNLIKLVSILTAESKLDFTPLLIPDKIGLAVDDFEVIITGSNFLDHPELTKIMLVRLSSNNSGLIIFLVVVGGNSKSLIALLADDLIDVSSWELQYSLHSLKKI